MFLYTRISYTQYIQEICEHLPFQALQMPGVSPG